MDDKIFEEMDNLDVNETDLVLEMVNVSEFEEEIDKATENRIKASVLNKAGMIKVESKKALIPNKPRLFAVSLIITLIELLFFTSSAFVAWMDGFLANSGINISLGGIVTTVLYLVLLGVLSLCVYKVWFNLDSEKLSIDMILPKTRTTIVYQLYFILSVVSKAIVILCFLFAKYLIDYLVFFGYEGFIVLLSLIPLISVLSAIDMLLAKLKNSIILMYENKKGIKYQWKLSSKSFWLEMLKYVGIIGYIALAALLRELRRINIFAFIIGLALFFALNIFMAFIVQLRKRYCLIVETKEEKVGTEKETNKSEVKTVDKRSLLKGREFLLGLSAVATIYLFCLSIPYTIYPGLAAQKPLLETFSDLDEVNDFFQRRKLPFAQEFLAHRVGYFTNSLFNINKLIVGTIINKQYLGLISGGTKVIDIAGPVDPVRPGSTNSESLFGGIESTDGYSTTNIQVDNVDEADVIKTDGKYTYYINKSKLYILDTYPPEQMNIVYEYDFSNEKLYPLELFLYEDRIALILSDAQYYNSVNRYVRNSNISVVKTYNISNPEKPILERTFKLDYPYLTSRMIDNHLYIVASARIYGDKSMPNYLDSAIGDLKKDIDYKDLFLMRGNAGDEYTQINVVAALPIDNPYSKAQVKAFLGGGGETVYVSTEHIYIVETKSNAITETSMGKFINSLIDEDYRGMDFLEYGTSIYRVKIQDGDIGDFDSAFVPGVVHNQFSMDEYDGYFRITTQKGRWSFASSNVYVLDPDMNVCGSLEGLAPEESIYASRFMGDRLYLVTFKAVDPLFVISLKDPRNPTVLGELKIPGYSEYLHPLDENHIIGFGKDTAGGDESFSYYQGLKMAIFDVSDVKNPKEKFVEIIGDRGTESELLSNHKALMYMKNLELMAFPVTLYERKKEGSDFDYGEFTYQGAYVYNVNSIEGFKLRGKITHLDSFDDIEDWYSYENASFINRIIYANSSLYTFSGDKVKATKYSDMKEISEIDLK